MAPQKHTAAAALILLLLPAHLAWASARLAVQDPNVDPYRWLEVVSDSRVSSWVESQNNRTLAKLGEPRSSPLFPEVLELLERSPKLPSVEVRGGLVYNFWQDAGHRRGLWRRTTLESFRGAAPAWEEVLDLDKLAEAEREPWVWDGCITLSAGPEEPEDLCLMQLSRGGADAQVTREFNITSKAFVAGGFVLPEGKTRLSYRDRDSVFVGMDCGEGSLTSSGYPRTVRLWARGKEACSSPVVFSGEEADVSVAAWRTRDWRGNVQEWHRRQTSFFEAETWVRIVQGKGSGPEFKKLEVPGTTEIFNFGEELVLSLKSDFAASPTMLLTEGSVVAAPLAAFLQGGRVAWTMLFRPTANQSCAGIVQTRNTLVLKVLDAVKTRLVSWRYAAGGGWVSTHSAVFTATVGVRAFDAQKSDALWMTSQSFLEPPTLSLAPAPDRVAEAETLKSSPAMFNTAGLEVSQQWAESKDGTRVPYFLIKKAGAPSDQPTILYGYGGFEISLLPRYSKTRGRAWLEKGGAFALANIRGGGEFGPGWHQAAMREGKHRSYEDFAAVAERLIRTGVTSPGKLAAMGGSNGGLLVGNMLVKYPHLFGAIVCNVPLLDMWRYNKLLAGASWVGEYGSPDVASDWGFLQYNSPYHLLDAGKSYPPVLFMTSTRDDRVHPAHARKMAARMQRQLPQAAEHVLFHEAVEGGHGGGLSKQVAEDISLIYTFLGKTLGLEVRTRRLQAEILV